MQPSVHGCESALAVFLAAAFRIFFPILGALILFGCSPALRRPILAKDELRTLTGYYVYQGRESEAGLPKTLVDCETFLKRSPATRDELIAAVCNLNLKHAEAAKQSAGKLTDTLRYRHSEYAEVPKQKDGDNIHQTMVNAMVETLSLCFKDLNAKVIEAIAKK